MSQVIESVTKLKQKILNEAQQQVSYDCDYMSNEEYLKSWGADAEMEYIRNNGGDWIDD